MPDLYHEWGEDLVATSSGDFETVDGVTLGEQRVSRRLMTPAGAYIWHPTYGAGLPQLVGSTADDATIVSVIRGQMFQEACVAKTPAPVVTINRGPTSGDVVVNISYTDALSGLQASLTFDLGS